MGSDGAMGIRAIKENNGIVMVQEPSTAKFDSMPRSAIEAVTVDIIAPPNELPEKLLTFLNHIPIIKLNLESEVKDKSALEKIIILLRTFTGNDFSMYKKNTIYRRIERRMGVHKIDKISSYVHFLQGNPKEVEILFKELMIGVTNFFRDREVWEKLNKKHMPNFIANLPAYTNLRAWIPACSTGEEAYSLAIVFKEALSKINPYKRISLQIFATDLDNEAIEVARKGFFPVNIAADVSPARLNRFFTKTDDGYRINNEIREMVVFAQHNLIMHPPFTKIDFISCRNLLIYMEPELQKKVLRLFYYSINNNGLLILGNSETVGTMNHLFTAEDTKLKIYKPILNALIPDLFNFPTSFTRNKPSTIEVQTSITPPPNIQTLADQLLLQHFSPPGVLVNENGDVIYISGRTGKYLEPAVGKANLNIFAMLREGLLTEFPVAFRKAIREKGSAVMNNVKVGTNGSSHTLNINIQWIEKPEPLRGTVMIVFTDVHDIHDIQDLNASNKSSHKVEKNSLELKLEKKLQNTREQMQTSVEEMQASQEELRSTNEELQSSNEELQSTNEELTSSKEEMQSLNEEMQTINAELQSKVDDFSRIDNDMKNLLNSTDIATLFLDKELNIRRYTNQANKIFKLIKSDVGRPFTDQGTVIIYPEMADDALEVLRTLLYIEKQIPSKDGRWFSIRIMPYRTFDDRIDGLVITFIDITELKKVEGKLFEAEQVHEMLINSSSDVIIKLSSDLKILEFNAKAENFFGITSKAAFKQNFLKLLIPEQAQKKSEKEMIKILSEQQEIKIKLQVKAAKGNNPVVEWEIKILHNCMKIATGIIMIKNDADE